MSTILRGIAFVATKGQSLGGFPPAFRELIRYEIGNGPSIVLLLVTLGGSVFLRRLVFGRHIYAIGGNELAGPFNGIRIGRVEAGVYLRSGFTAGVAALLSLGCFGAATSGDGKGYELNVIAAAVVGGANDPDSRLGLGSFGMKAPVLEHFRRITDSDTEYRLALLREEVTRHAGEAVAKEE